MTAPITFNRKMAEKPQGSKTLTIFMVTLLIVVVTVGLYFAFAIEDSILEMDSSNRLVFKDALTKVCGKADSRLHYEGVDTFFHYLNHPQQELCSSWTKLNKGEHIPRLEKNDSTRLSNMDEGNDVTSWDYLCLPDSEKHMENPCIVYTFTEEWQEHIAKHFHSRGCSVHVFPQQVPTHQHDQPSIISDELSNPSDIVGHPKDIRIINNKHLQQQSVGDLTSALGESNQKIRFMNVDAEGREWAILKQLVTFSHLVDVQQISAKIYLPIHITQMTEEEKHLHFSELHQVLEGLNCLGYKLVRSIINTADTSGDTSEQRHPVSYQVNWLKSSQN